MDKGINKILDEFVKQSTAYLAADEIILYGSYAKGTERVDSDIDVAVIVNEFSGDFLDTYTRLFYIVSKIDYRREPVLLIRSNDKSGFIDHIKLYGKQLYSS